MANADENNGGLSICLKSEPASKRIFCEEAAETLGGTAKTLDEVDDTVSLGDGLCSMFGYTVLDDSGSMLLDEDGWIKELSIKNPTFTFSVAVIDMYWHITSIPEDL